MRAAQRVVGILAGGGSLPREIAEYVLARGDGVHVVAIKGEAEESLSQFPRTVTGWGQIGLMLKALKRAGCQELVIVGGVRRPDLAALRPDIGFFLNLPAILQVVASGGDDSLLSRVVKFFERKGLKVVAPGDVMPELVIGPGALGHLGSRNGDTSDIALGFEIIRALGPFDVGQAVIVSAGQAEAIEGAEGTDAMLERAAKKPRAKGGNGPERQGVLVKRPKPGQELRIDLPAIGPATLTGIEQSGLAGIAVLAGGAIAAERQVMIRQADEAGLFIVGVDDPHAGAKPRARTSQNWGIESISGPALTASQRFDALKGAAVLTALAPLAPSLGVVVSRRHVLAVEAGEGIPNLLERASRLRQWGRGRSRHGDGIAVLAQGVDVGAYLADAAAAGLAGVAFIGKLSKTIEPTAELADNHGLLLAALAPPGEQE